MTAITIIGFVNLSEIVKQCDSAVTLPKGWCVGGEEEIGDWHACQLILVDDNDFERQTIRIATIQPAIHVLHNGSYEKWPNQESWLKTQNWNSRRIDTFSHPGNHFFWEHTKNLIKATPAERSDWLRKIAGRYEVADQLRKLDTFAAWFTLFKTVGENDKAVRDACDVAFEELNGIGELGTGEGTLDTILGKADAEFWDLLSRSR